LPEAKNICVPYAEDLALISNAVRKAGQIAKQAFDDNDSKVWDKENDSPVTDADIAVNDYLAETLRSARPDYGWLSEETKDDHSRHACPRSFVVDPIDGTRAFIDRTPNFTVSVAIIEEGKSIAGALFNPLTGEMFEAFLGGGAKLNGETLSSPDSDKINGIRMVGYPRKFRRLGWPDMTCRIANSMAYRMALVASDQADATVAFTPKSDWDLAAAQLIATEAGAIVTNLYGKDPAYDGHKIKDFGFMGTTMSDHAEEIQLLHLVIGGELIDPNKTEFKNLKEVDFVGAYGSFADAKAAWKAAAQGSVDNAHMRYFVLHAHELIDPDKDGFIG